MRFITQREQIIAASENYGYRTYRIPGILALPGGALLLYCEARAGSCSDWGDIDIIVWRMEKDGALVESLRIGLSQRPPDGAMRAFHNPVMIPDGERIHLFYHRNYEQVFHRLSPDAGRSWSEARDITAVFRGFPFSWNVCATGPGHGIRMKSGRLVTAVWLANGTVHGDGVTRDHWPSIAGCIYSDDHGETWRPGALANSVMLFNGNETTVAELPDGRLLFNYRSMNAYRRRMLGLSKDGEYIDDIRCAEDLPDPMCSGGQASCSDGVLFGNCAAERQRVNVTVKHTADGGNGWQTVWEVDPLGGYVDIAWRDGKIYAFYERCFPGQSAVQALVLAIGSPLTPETVPIFSGGIM